MKQIDFDLDVDHAASARAMPWPSKVQAALLRLMAAAIIAGGNSLNNVANLHVIMAIRNCEFFEVLLPAGTQKYGLVEDVEVDGQGLVHAPRGPGLGARIDFDLIEQRRLSVLR